MIYCNMIYVTITDVKIFNKMKTFVEMLCILLIIPYILPLFLSHILPGILFFTFLWVCLLIMVTFLPIHPIFSWISTHIFQNNNELPFVDVCSLYICTISALIYDAIVMILCSICHCTRAFVITLILAMFLNITHISL